jgi:hypothetical protein
LQVIYSIYSFYLFMFTVFFAMERSKACLGSFCDPFFFTLTFFPFNI